MIDPFLFGAILLTSIGAVMALISIWFANTIRQLMISLSLSVIALFSLYVSLSLTG